MVTLFFRWTINPISNAESPNPSACGVTFDTLTTFLALASFTRSFAIARS